MTLRRFAPIVAALALVGGLSACGKHDRITEGETEGIYVDVGPMKYQVQISRELNPSIPEDQTFLSGLDPAEQQPGADETWFAVFVRIENEQDAPQAPATDYVIEDTEHQEYEPVAISEVNPFHYPTGDVPANSVIPNPDSIAAQNSVGGVELLFKLKRTTLDNRPLLLKIANPANEREVSEIDLDV